MTTTASPDRASFTVLAADVVTGAHDLAVAHGRQLQAEVRHEVTRAYAGTLTVAAGGALVALAAALGCVAIVTLLVERFGISPALAWGLVAAVAGLAGLAALWIGHRKLTAVSVLPTHTLHSIQESLQCVANR